MKVEEGLGRDLLVADIGGTNSRFGWFVLADDGGILRKESVWLPTKEADSFAGLFDMLARNGFSLQPKDCDAAAVAVPGAVREKRYADPPNVSYSMDTADVAERFGDAPLFLLNDFAAQGYACLTGAVRGADSGALGVKPGKADASGTMGVIGAGTGLGHCALVQGWDERRIAVPSENGHASFAFVGEEMEYEKFLRAETGMPFIFGDIVLSGRGLSLLHKFHTGEDLDPAEAAAKLPENEAVRTWFARLYGRGCRNYALALLAVGGMYIAGGVAAKNPMLVTDPAFTTEFVNSPAYGPVLKDIPVTLNVNEESGLWGAAQFAAYNIS
jgi:glucokinase